MDRVRSESRIREELEQEPIENKISKRKLNWYGNIVRMDPNRLLRRVTETK